MPGEFCTPIISKSLASSDIAMSGRILPNLCLLTCDDTTFVCSGRAHAWH